jgi:hypothetical protein
MNGELIWMRKCELSAFPNIDTKAYYDGIKQVIVLNSVETSELEDSNENRIWEIMKLTRHEVQHYLDNISTLWGRTHLINTFNAIDAYHKNDINKFWIVNLLYKDLMKNKFSKYYSTKGDPANSKYLPWKYEFTSGLRFNSTGNLNPQKPILFTRFSSNHDQFLCRVPITVESLLEVNSMASEMNIDILNIASMDKESQLVQQHILKREYMDLLYNVDFTIYSVAVHLTANLLNIDDVAIALQISKMVSNMALNLPESYFQNIKIPEELNTWDSKNTYFLREKDRGYVYFVLLYNYRKMYNGQFDIDELLFASELPKEEIIFLDVNKIMIEQVEKVNCGIFAERLKQHLTNGYDFFSKYRVNRKAWSMTEIVTKYDIPIIYGDMIYESEWDKYTDDFYKFMIEFSSICGL